MRSLQSQKTLLYTLLKSAVSLKVPTVLNVQLLLAGQLLYHCLCWGGPARQRLFFLSEVERLTDAGEFGRQLKIIGMVLGLAIDGGREAVWSIHVVNFVHIAVSGLI